MISVYLTKAEEADLRKAAYLEGEEIGAEIGVSTYAHMLIAEALERRRGIIEMLDAEYAEHLEREKKRFKYKKTEKTEEKNHENEQNRSRD